MDGVLGTWQLKHTLCRNPPLLDQITSTDKSDKKKTSQLKNSDYTQEDYQQNQ